MAPKPGRQESMLLDLDALIQPLDPLPSSGPQNPPPRPRQPLWWRIGQWLSAYLPLLLMALLALATWWLVQNTPRPVEPGQAPTVRHVPDYTMEGFTMQRYAADGRVRVQVQGASMRHYPDTDTYEIDGVQIRAEQPDGRVTVATARRALSNADASEVQLQGQARVVHGGDGNGVPVEFESEFLHAFLATEKLRSHLPVRLVQGADELRAGSLDYDHRSSQARLGGPVRGRFAPPAARARR
jgi:lipopolysaccharide export system protein LptC